VRRRRRGTGLRASFKAREGENEGIHSGRGVQGE
jgi:hypothetical protein